MYLNRIGSAFLVFLLLIVVFYFNVFLFQIFSGLGFLLITAWTSWLLSEPFMDYFLITRKWNAEKRAVVITGCDTGFGHELAIKLSYFGYKVFAGCLFPDGQGAKRLKSLDKGNLFVFKLDVTKDDDVQAAVKLVKENLERRYLWALVNNAGIVTYKGIEYGPPGIESYEKHMAVNALGTVRVTKAFMPLIRRTKNSRVIMMASLASRVCFPALTEYTMSKFAVRAFANAVRHELEEYGCYVSILEPTMYRTAMGDEDFLLSGLDKSWEETPQEIKQQIGGQRHQWLKGYVRDFIRTGTDASKVVDTMFDAVICSTPKCVYRLGTIFIRSATYIAEQVPEEIHDKLLCGNLAVYLYKAFALIHRILNL